MWKNKAWAKVRLYTPAAVIAGLFMLLAGRIAFVRQFPLPYDEGYHLGLIKLYTHHLNPFLSGQPAGADPLGAVARDPSYLYHYLMSFPLRLLQALHLSQFGQIWALRAIDISLGLVSLYLIYRLARRLGVSRPWAQLAALAMAITPVFYDLSAQINYDNLLLPLTLLTALSLLSVSRWLRQGIVSAPQLAYVGVLMTLASLVKYSFLPIAAAAVVYLIILALRHMGIRGFLAHWWGSFARLKVTSQATLIVVLLVAGTLGFQRYGVNMLTYHTPHPQCGVVLSVQQCSAYGPWARNYQLHQTAAARPIAGLQLAAYTKYWAREMYFEVFSTVHATPDAVVYTPMMPLARIAVKLLAGLGVVTAMVLVLSAGVRRQQWLMLVVLGAGYVMALWTQNFSDFHNLHFPIAIQGRYLLVLIPFAYVFAASGYSRMVVGVRSIYVAALSRPASPAGRVIRLEWGRRAASQTVRVMASLHLL